MTLKLAVGILALNMMYDDVFPTSGQPASCPRLRLLPSHPSTGCTAPHTAGCPGYSAGNPVRRKQQQNNIN